jgi:hypothetical protein
VSAGFGNGAFELMSVSTHVGEVWVEVFPLTRKQNPADGEKLCPLATLEERGK